MKRVSSITVFVVSMLTVNLLSAAEPLVRTAKIPLKGVAGKLDHIAVDSMNQRLFLANKPNNTLDIVDLKTGSLVKQIPDQGKVSGVAYASDLDMIYVGNGVGVCNGFDGNDFHQVFSTPAPAADNVHYHSGNKKVYVGQDEILSELDATTGQVSASMSLPGAVHGFKIDKKAGTIFGVLTKPSLIAVINIDKHKVVETFALTVSDAGSPIAQDVDNGLLFVGCPKAKPKVLVFDVKTGKEVASVDIPAGVDDLHFDSKRHSLYASCSAEALVVIERTADTYAVISKLPTPKDSRTCAWSHGKLYLGVPKSESTEGPEIWIYDAPPLQSQ